MFVGFDLYFRFWFSVFCTVGGLGVGLVVWLSAFGLGVLLGIGLCVCVWLGLRL